MPLVLPRRSLNLDFVRDGQASGDNYPTELSKLDGLLTFSRSTTATRFNAAGVLETVAAGQPRFDFDPVTLACKGLLIEEARTNLCLRSSEFDNTGVWFNSVAGTGVAASRTANYAPAPDGTITADRLIFDRGASNTAGDSSLANQAVAVTVGQPYTFSVWLKAAAPTNLIIRHVASAGYTNLAVNTAWQRFTVTEIPSAASAYIELGLRGAFGAANQTADVQIWGAQLEQGSFATSYIPTTSAAVTRAAESCYTTALSPWFNKDAGTWLTEADSGTDQSTNAFVLCGRNGTVLLPAILKSLAGMAKVRGEWYDGTTDYSFYSATTWGASAIKAALSYSGNTKKFSAAGETAQTASAAMVVSPTTFYLGSRDGSVDFLNGHLCRLTYLPYAVSDTLLKQLTA